MGVGGRSLLKDYTIEEIAELLEQNYGKISDVSQKMGCSRNAIYDLLHEYECLQVARKEGARRKRDRKFETAEEVIEKILDRADTDPDLAARQAQFILKHAKNSPYNPQNTNDSTGEEVEAAKDLVADVRRQLENG